MLYKTYAWDIGKENIAPVYLDTQSSVTNYIGKKVTLSIFGIPVRFEDFKKHKLSFEVTPSNS